MTETNAVNAYNRLLGNPSTRTSLPSPEAHAPSDDAVGPDENEAELEAEESEQGSETESEEASAGEPDASESLSADSDDSEAREGSDESDENSKTWKQKYQEAEEKRRGFQSEAQQARNLLQQAIEQVKAGNVPQQQQSADTGGELTLSDALNEMGVDPEDSPTADQITRAWSLVEHSKNYQRQQQTAQQYEQAAKTAVSQKEDLSEVIGFFQERKMNQDSEATLLNPLGNYWRARSVKLEEENKKLEQELAKLRQTGGADKDKKKSRQKATKGKEDVPPVPGGRNKRPSPSKAPKGGFWEEIERRAKTMGQLS